MLKNKFGMLKVLALALSVLMLVSLAACGNNGVAKEDMDSAIAAALAEQSKAEASKQAALESSLAAAQAAAESERKAVESSLAAAAAAASKAAEEASKAAVSAEKKASEEASKAAAEASKAAASASKALEEATRTTTTKATETTAPIVKDDLTAVQTEFAKLKHELVVANADYYLADDYAELALMFDKAAVELQNAQTVAAAESILATLKVEATAVKNAKTDAAAVQALIAALGDVETDVFTTAYDKTEEAVDALHQLLLDYDEYFETKFEDKDDKDIDEITAYDADKVEDLGIDEIALDKAVAKIGVLVEYVKASLKADMKLLFNTFDDLDFDDEGADLNDPIGAVKAEDVIADAYYKYLVINKVNGGDVAAADLAIEWDYLYNEDTGKVVKAPKNNTTYKNEWTGAFYAEGEKVHNFDAPTAWFTAEEFMEIFATPYLNDALQATKEAASDALYKKLTVAKGETGVAAIYTNIAAAAKNDYVVAYGDAEDALEEIAEEFEAALEDVTFVGDYKGSVSLEEAQIDIWTKYVNAYIEAANSLVENSKVSALELYAEQYGDAVEELHEDYEDRTDESSAAALAQKLANLETKKAAFEANVEAAPVYTLADLTNVDLLKKYDASYNKEDPYYDIVEYYILANGVSTELVEYINKVVTAALTKSFGTSGISQTGTLGDVAYGVVEDLLALRDRLDPTSDDADIYNEETRGALISYVDGSDYKFNKYYANIPAFEKMLETIDTAIEAIQAVSAENFADEEVQILTPDSNAFGSNNKKAKLYWISEAAKEYVEKEEYSDAWLYSNDNADAWYELTPYKIDYINKDGKAASGYMKIHETDEAGNLLYAKCEGEHGERKVADYSKKTVNDLIHAKKNADGSYSICECDQKISATSNVADYKTNEKGEFISNSSKSGDFLTLNDTGIPFTYTRTAEEKAIVEVNKLYNNAYNDVHKAIMGLVGYYDTYVAEITGTDAYEAILDNVAGNETLKAEVEAFAKVYTGYLNTLTGTRYAFTNESITGVASTTNYISTPTFSGNVATGAEAAYFTYKEAPGNATRYKYINVEDCMDSIVSEFNSKFYTSDGDSNVVELWNYKQEAIDYISQTINGYQDEDGDWVVGYKNHYYTAKTTDGAIVTYVPAQTVGSYYVYDTGLTAASTKGAAFEAQLSALLENYIAKIEGVKLNANSDIKDFYGSKLLGKADTAYNKKPIENGLKTGKWTISSAKKTVNAYVVDLLGYEAVKSVNTSWLKSAAVVDDPETPDVDETAAAVYYTYTNGVKENYEDTEYKTLAADGNKINTGDSQVLVAYKTYFEKDYTAYAPNLYDATCSCGGNIVK